MLTKTDAARLSHYQQRAAEISPAQLEAMADRLLEDSPSEAGIKSRHQMRHAARKERPRGATPIRNGRHFEQVG